MGIQQAFLNDVGITFYDGNLYLPPHSDLRTVEFSANGSMYTVPAASGGNAWASPSALVSSTAFQIRFTLQNGAAYWVIFGTWLDLASSHTVAFDGFTSGDRVLVEIRNTATEEIVASWVVRTTY